MREWLPEAPLGVHWIVARMACQAFCTGPIESLTRSEDTVRSSFNHRLRLLQGVGEFCNE